MKVEEFLSEAGVMKSIKHPNLVQLLGKNTDTQQDYYSWQGGTLLHSYCTGTYTKVTVLLL